MNLEQTVEFILKLCTHMMDRQPWVHLSMYRYSGEGLRPTFMKGDLVFEAESAITGNCKTVSGHGFTPSAACENLLERMVEMAEEESAADLSKLDRDRERGEKRQRFLAEIEKDLGSS